MRELATPFAGALLQVRRTKGSVADEQQWTRAEKFERGRGLPHSRHTTATIVWSKPSSAGQWCSTDKGD
jgi:hypothetical protein